MKRRFVVTVRAKIMGTIFLVSCLVLAVAAADSYAAHREKDRGNFLEKHYKRFDAYRRGIGKTLGSTGAYLAGDPELVAAFTERDEPRMQRVAERAARALAQTVEPDLVLFMNSAGGVVDARGTTHLTPAQLRSSALLGDVQNGRSVDAQLALIAGRVYQVSATPVRDADDHVIGGVVLGATLDGYMSEYGTQSDSDVSKQHRLTLVDADGAVLASVFPASAREELADSLQPGKYAKEAEGERTVPVVVFKGERYDFYTQEVSGYVGGQFQKIGTIFLMRTRDFKATEFKDRLLGSLVLFGIVGLVALGFGYLLSIGITRPIQRYVRATADLAQGRGDLTKRLDESSRDELGLLAANLNAVFANIQSLATKVQRAAFQVGASSAEISAASKQMLGGAREQARHTEGSTAAVTELSASIQQVAENAMEATRVAKSSGEAVQAAIERMNQIRATVEEAAARITELGESGKRIGNIVEVIRQISDQTTLLALNAAIEAAHAGEQGRGFAVVADEVSSLAKRVGQSARDIEDLIATIKEQTSEAVRSMSAGTREVEAGTTLVARTLADLQKLVQVVADTATAVQEQAVASDEIARNMDVVQKIAQEVLGSSEEAVEQGEHLHKLAHQLEESVKGFRTDSSKGAAGEPLAELPAETSRDHT